MTKQTHFTFQGHTGHIDAFGFITWAGMGFQIEAASAEMRAAIAKARGAA